MDESKINDIINSQKDFLDSNSNTINSRILLLKKLLINIKLFEEEIYEALSALTRKIPNDIQIYYEDGSIRISAEQ